MMIGQHIHTACLSLAWQPFVFGHQLCRGQQPPPRRAKWSSMQVLFQFGWSGSAVLGGWLVDRCGFQVAFLVTGER